MHISHNSFHQHLLRVRHQRPVPVLGDGGWGALRWGDSRNVEARGCIIDWGEASKEPEEGHGAQAGGGEGTRPWKG